MTRIDGEGIKAARCKKGWTQFQLAVATGLHPATISLAERGACSRGSVDRIAAALGVEAGALVLSREGA